MDLAAAGVRLFDSDSHYYEPHDCFTRHIERRFRDRAVNVRPGDDGLGRVYLGDQRLGYMSVIQTDYIGPPGALEEVMAGRVARDRIVIEPIRPGDLPHMVERGPRLAVMDDQGIEAAIMLPTLGVCVEHELHRDVPASYANLRSFNRWLEEDWGFGADGRLFGVALLSLLDVALACEELDRVLDAGARFVHLRPGPVYGRSPADPQFDPFWARIAEAGVPVIFHIGDSGYNELWSTQWGERPNPPVHLHSAFQFATCFSDRPIIDTMAALVLHNLFGRHPGVRVISIENGSDWVPNLMKRMDKAAESGRHGPWLGGEVQDRPSEVFAAHAYVVPFHEEDVLGLIGRIGSGHVLFGSDYPHPEGLAEPRTFARCLDGADDATVRAVMRDNGWGLASPPSA